MQFPKTKSSRMRENALPATETPFKPVPATNHITQMRGHTKPCSEEFKARRCMPPSPLCCLLAEPKRRGECWRSDQSRRPLLRMETFVLTGRGLGLLAFAPHLTSRWIYELFEEIGGENKRHEHGNKLPDPSQFLT